MDEKEEPKFEVSFWQWIKGEHAPNVETTLKEITLGTDDYLVFKSGTQVNKKLIDDYVVKIPSLNEPKISIENYLQKQKVNEQVSQDAQHDFNNPGMEQIIDDKDKNNLGNAENVPHPDDAQEMMKWEAKHKNAQQSTNQPVNQPQQSVQKDPLLDLLEKSKKEKVKIKIEVDVEIPSNLFLQILLDSYEDKKDLILDYTLTLMKNDSFNDELKKFIEKYVKK